MNNRGERREEIKLRLEYGKALISLLGIFALVFGVLQWVSSFRLANYANHERMTLEWRDHMRSFVHNPSLRPYFEEGTALTADDPNRELVLALADVRVDLMDAILMYPTLLGRDDRKVMEGWRDWQSTFVSAFRTSPALCARFHETKANYLFIVRLGQEVCGNSN